MLKISKNKKACLFIFGLLFVSSFVTACGTEPIQPETHANVSGEITDQTANISYTKEELVSGDYYLLHDGRYYPLFRDVSVNFSSIAEEAANPNRKIFIASEDEHQIPTLFLGSDDKIIFYSKERLIDYIVWERFKDEGYTIGFNNIKTMESKRIYLDFSEDATSSLVSFSDTAGLAELEVPYILIDKIGGIQMTSDAVKDGMITGLAKDGNYNVDLYVGTNYMHHLATANVKVLRAMELFASTKYETLRADTYIIDVPDYLITGYYTIANNGIIRIVKDESYSQYTFYNEPLLLCDTSSPAQYSEYAPLNHFKSDIPGTLGYGAIMGEESDGKTPIKFKEAAIVIRKLYFPMDTNCKINVLTTENAGESYVTIGSKRYYLQPQDGCFSIELLGDGEEGTLTITSFFDPIKIDYYGCTETIPNSSEENTDESEV